MMWSIATVLVLVVGGGFFLYIRGILKESRNISFREAEAERRKAAKRIAEYINRRKESEAAAREASKRREEVEHEVAKDRERAGRGDDAIGDLRRRLARLTGDQRDDDPSGGSGSH